MALTLISVETGGDMAVIVIRLGHGGVVADDSHQC